MNMKKYWRLFLIMIVSIRFIPHIIVLLNHRDSDILRYELNKWIEILRVKNKGVKGFVFLLNSLPEYRYIFYYRLGITGKWLNILAGKSKMIFVDTLPKDMGKGLIFQHGFSTIVNAKSIGDDCQIWHSVTIGLSESGTNKKPTIGNNVKVCTGAIVVGDIVINDNVTIGAGAVVTKSVPKSCIVVGNPAYIIRRDNVRVHESL
jgi:serine O-acetyltransferase